MNPSASYWIDKYFAEQGKTLLSMESYLEIYNIARNTGFIYGHVVYLHTVQPINISGWTTEEISKVALLNTLSRVYSFETNDSSADNFLYHLDRFYSNIYPDKFSIIRKILPNERASIRLEKIISTRVQTNNNIIIKNFSHILTNALLFVDVLAFRKYLSKGKLPKNYLSKIERTLVGIISISLQSKSNKSTHDNLLIKLFDNSLRYTKFSAIQIEDLESIKLEYFSNELERFYFSDLATMAMFSDEILNENEKEFLYELGKILKLDRDFINTSIKSTGDFISENRKKISYFNYSSPVKHFYDHTSQTIVLLVNRNKKRLIKEISNSKELVKLLAKSTHKDLDDLEKKSVKKQLLEICKTIPSLTIFLLPGGSLLLPVLIKLIPQLLPSAFNENTEDAD
jgi:hypothetical protein